MNQLLRLLRHDFMLLYRNKLIAVSIIVTAIYLVIFKSISHLGNTDKVLILVIFNDPALLGFLFTGVMVLFEKNENTLQALTVCPISRRNYILSKTISLTTISLVCCFTLALASNRTFNYVHYFFACLLTTILFSLLGFILISGVTTFNRFLLKAIGALIFLSLPFLAYFGVFPRAYFLWIPTQPCVDLFTAATDQQAPIGTILFGYTAISVWLVVAAIGANKLFKADLNN